MNAKMERGDLSRFAETVGIAVSYAHDLLSEPGSKRHKKPPIPLAILIYARTGRKLGIMQYADTRQANMLVRLAHRAGVIPDTGVVEPA